MQAAERHLESNLRCDQDPNLVKPLAEGVLFERRVFQSQIALEDQKEGMAAFLEKRKPVFKHA